MHHCRSAIGTSVVAICALTALGAHQSARPVGPRFAVSFPATLVSQPLDGRLLLMLSNDDSAEPRLQILDGPNTQQAFGIDVEQWRPGVEAVIDAGVLGYPRESLTDVPARHLHRAGASPSL